MLSIRNFSMLLITMIAFLTLIFSHSALALPSTEQQVPLESEPKFWTKEAKLISFKCKNLHLEARSRLKPSVKFDISSGLFNLKDCKQSIASLETKGCFCDGDALKCMESEKSEPYGIVCPTGFICFEFKGKKTGVIQVKELGKHITQSACLKELADLERD